MPPSRAAKGKKRAYHESSDSDSQDAQSISTAHMEAPPTIKKSKRAVTRKCPVCQEEIPVRLLEKHVDWEAEKLDEIISAIGSVDILDIAEPDDGQTARTRKSAVKARKNMQPTSRFGAAHSDTATLELIDKSLRLIKRHRKQRHTKLHDMSRDDEDTGGLSGFQGGRGRWAGTGEGTLCPVCMKTIPGDADVVEAHVDACLAYESRLQEEREAAERERQREQSPWEEIDIDGDVHIRVTDGANLRGLGFTVRDDSQHDVDDEIDVDGEDEDIYGAAQFGESDVLNPLSAGPVDEDEDVDVDDDVTQSPGASGSGDSRSMNKTVQDLAAEGKLVKKAVARGSPSLDGVKQTMDEIMGIGETEELDKAVELARRSGNMHALVDALQEKVKMLESTKVTSATTLLCRICLDPYVEPTASTGCWHTCCRECWLRCLGSTKLCPICKRITAAADLRRIYI